VAWVCTLVALILVRVPFQTGFLTFQLNSAGACPPTPLHAHPESFHFEPGLEQHQSWMGVLVPEPDATDFLLCLDGQLVDTDVGETPVLGRVSVNVRTTWVDLQWFLGALGLYEDPERWDIGYTTYTLKNAGSH
jgi:hypothetical protein